MNMFRSISKNVSPRLLRWIPWGVTGFLLFAALLRFSEAALGSLPVILTKALDTLSNFSAVFLGIFVEAVPFLLLGTLASGIVEVFVSRDELMRWVPQQGIGSALAGSLMGLFFPVCECGVVPFTRRLVRKGLPLSAGISLLLAAPVVNPIVIASTLAAFGAGPVFWGRIIASLLIAFLTGLVFTLAQPQEVLRSAPVIALPPVILPLESPAQTPLSQRIRQVLILAADEFFEMGRFLVLGALLAAFMQTFIPQAGLLVLGQGPVLSVFVMIALAILLSVCSTVDAFIALAFTGTFTTGSILAFLVFGPMVDIKSTLMFLRVFKPRAVLYLILLPLLMTALWMVGVNLWGGWG
ncbi:hypothetical membrane protein [Anaerolinea thermophila UNI-1]|uniref:Hypothetical membrane protein n=2 Tax=Anaerolinea thermophila TaxID=167964 RepID=E8MYJ8_ANATU|nr:hypothetical membrane protein [Anaerolinea thermophila UNI-1]